MLGAGVQVEIIDRRGMGRALFPATGPGESLLALLDEIGEVPLPPYIEAARRRGGELAAVDDRARYQTSSPTTPARSRRRPRACISRPR